MYVRTEGSIYCASQSYLCLFPILPHTNLVRTRQWLDNETRLSPRTQKPEWTWTCVGKWRQSIEPQAADSVCLHWHLIIQLVRKLDTVSQTLSLYLVLKIVILSRISLACLIFRMAASARSYRHVCRNISQKTFQGGKKKKHALSALQVYNPRFPYCADATHTH